MQLHKMTDWEWEAYTSRMEKIEAVVWRCVCVAVIVFILIATIANMYMLTCVVKDHYKRVIVPGRTLDAHYEDMRNS